MQQTAKKNGKDKGTRQKIVLAYSGGLDTSIAIRWLADTYNADVVCVLVDVGQPTEGFQAALAKAKKIGAVASYGIDAREEFAREYIAPAIHANALYEKHYPLATALARPLIAAGLFYGVGVLPLDKAEPLLVNDDLASPLVAFSTRGTLLAFSDDAALAVQMRGNEPARVQRLPWHERPVAVTPGPERDQVIAVFADATWQVVQYSSKP